LHVLVALATIGAWPERLATAATSQERAAVRQRLASGVLHWGGDEEGGIPFQFRDPEHPERLLGFEVELADALARELSVLLKHKIVAQFTPYEWVSLATGLARGDFDVILSGYEITPERKQQMRFTRPYYIYAQQLVVRQDEQRIRRLADCRGLAVGTLSGSAAERVLEIAGIVQRVGFDGQVEPFLELELGRVDAVLLDTPIVTFYAEPNPRLRTVGAPFAHGAYGIALRPADAALAACLDEALGRLMEKGELAQILGKWRLWNTDQARLARPPRAAAELAGLGFDPQGRPLPGRPQPREVVAPDLVTRGAARLSFWRYAPLLLRAAGVTVLLTVLSMGVAMAVGLVVAVARLYGPRPLRALALVYVEFFRGIPLLLLLFFLYFGLAQFGVEMPAVLTAILGFGLNYAAYEAEIYRSAILSVPARQWEAARALGMTEALAFRRIIFPQAFRTALGPMTNDFVALFKDTSLVSVIAVRELTKEYLVLARSSLQFVELGLLTAALYLLMSVPLGYLSRWLEQRAGAR
jgi:polar amino acid transport system substrate-binding protein